MTGPFRSAPRHDVTQLAARQVWEALFLRPWPEGWRVVWSRRDDHLLGETLHASQTIVLSLPHAWQGSGGGVLRTLAHEFIHVVYPKLPHGSEFEALEALFWIRLGLVTSEQLRAERREAAQVTFQSLYLGSFPALTAAALGKGAALAKAQYVYDLETIGWGPSPLGAAWEVWDRGGRVRTRGDGGGGGGAGRSLFQLR